MKSFWRVITILGLALISLPARAGVEDFTIPNFEADYYLSRDTNHISHLRVEEQIVALFPTSDQNHGILRAIPKSYEHHDVNLHVSSVTDDRDEELDYSQSTSNGNLVLKIGNADTYVHGRQTYRIAYTMDNVTTSTGGRDGFFWDVNGDQWSQVFGRVTARVHLEGDLAAQMQPEHNRCFTGVTGSTTHDCTVSPASLGADDTVITTTTTGQLGSGQTLTTETGFMPGTFAAYHLPTSQLIRILALLIFLGVLPVVLALTIGLRRWWRYGRDPHGRGVIVPQYLPPKDLSVLASSNLLKLKFEPKAISAQIIDLAVRHYLKIYEVKESGLFKAKTAYEIELVRPTDSLRAEERAVVDMLFDANAATGARVQLKDLANKLYKEADQIGKSVELQLVERRLLAADPAKARMPFIIISIVLFFVSFFGFPYTIGLLIAGAILFIIGLAMPARSAAGVEQRDYLLGLKQYMKIAEAERLKVLQGPRGELTEKIDINDHTQLVKLYERLLPYAMLFDIEQAWAKQFAGLYDSPPDWYSGTGTFNAVYFAGTLHSFDAASTTSFTSPSSSSGGGSAGGGGGGGGGGGW